MRCIRHRIDIWPSDFRMETTAGNFLQYTELDFIQPAKRRKFSIDCLQPGQSATPAAWAGPDCHAHLCARCGLEYTPGNCFIRIQSSGSQEGGTRNEERFF